jgi:ferredoxin
MLTSGQVFAEWVRTGEARTPKARGNLCTVPDAALWQNRTLPTDDPARGHMAYVITEPCIGTKDNSCVEVCPVDCIHPTPDEPDYDKVEMLYIDPEECIDCDACVEACPVDACFAEDQVPDEWNKFVQLNADYFKNT